MDIANVSYLLVFTLLLLESSVIVGLFAPGVTALVGASFLGATGQLDPVLVFATGMAGVIVGDTLGYLLGRNAVRFPKIRAMIAKLSKTVDIKALQKSRKLVFFQFPVITRAPAPLLLGATGFSLPSWIALELIASTLFVSTIFAIGYLTGSLTGSIASATRVAAYVQLVFLAVVITIGIIAFVRYKKHGHVFGGSASDKPKA